jgi:hypothetical protein
MQTRSPEAQAVRSEPPAAVDEPVVTIITPTYNHARYIRDTLESTRAQTDGRWEQIVVDDGSSDETAAIVEAFDDPRVRLVRREHRGIMHLAETYNAALELARGRYIAVLEGDDFWPSDKIERQLPLFDRPDIVLTWGVAEITEEAAWFLHLTPPPGAPARLRNRSQAEYVRVLLERNVIPAGTVMARRDALVSIGGFQQPADVPTTDYPTWLALCRVGRFAVTTEVLGAHRRHADQVTKRMKSEMTLAVDWGIRYIKGLPSAERRALGLSDRVLRTIELHRRGYLDYEAGRLALDQGRRAEARALLRRAARTASPGVRLKAGVALLAALVGLDVDGVMAIAKRVRGH